MAECSNIKEEKVTALMAPQGQRCSLRQHREIHAACYDQRMCGNSFLPEFLRLKPQSRLFA